MAVIECLSSDNINNLDEYILNGEAHNKQFTNQRNIILGVHNLKSDYNGKLNNAGYIVSQQHALSSMQLIKFKKRTKHKGKTQAYHLIFSFSKDDFGSPKNKKDMLQKAKQAYKLVNDFLKHELPDTAQYFTGIQWDGEGGMLHAHTCLNKTLMDGHAMPTDILSMNRRITNRKFKYHTDPTTHKQHKKLISYKMSAGLRKRFQNYLADNAFQAVTGRKYEVIPIEPNKTNIIKASEAQMQKRGAYDWRSDLKDKIIEAVQSGATDEDSFLDALQQEGVVVKKRRQGIGKDKSGKKHMRPAYSYHFVDAKGKKRETRDFGYSKYGGIKGLGTDFTPDAIDVQLQANLQKQLSQEEQAVSNQEVSVKEQINNDNQTWQRVESGAGDQSAEEQEQSEPEIRPAKHIEQVQVSAAAADDNTAYDQHTEELRQANKRQADAINQTVQRQQHEVTAERSKQRKRRYKAKQQLAEQSQERPHDNKKQSNKDVKHAGAIKSKSDGTERQSDYDEPDY